MGTNQVSLVNDPLNAYQGNNLLALASGSLSTSLPTVPGQTYSVTFAYRGPGIAAWWRAEDNANDSVNGNNATTVQNIAYPNGEVGKALQFDGSTSLITVPASASLAVSNLTLEAWIFQTDQNTGRPIIDYGGAGQSANIHLWVNTGGGNSVYPGGLHALLRNIVEVDDNNPVVKLNQWNHVAFTANFKGRLNTATGILYCNGVPVMTNTASGSLLSSFEPVNLGYRNSATTESFQTAGVRFLGNMDEASIYNRPLSDSEIKAIYNLGTAGKFDPAVFNTSPAQSLAEIKVSLTGQASATINGNNTNWQTYTATFTATTNTTTLSLTGLEPGMLLGPLVTTSPVLITNVVTNILYLTFTEDTNLTTTPIKFAVPPFIGSALTIGATIMNDGFENAAVGNNIGTGSYIDGWHVDQDNIDVYPLGYAGEGAAYEGQQWIDIQGNAPGIISTNIATIPGTQYQVSFAYRLNPDSATIGPASANISVDGNLILNVVAPTNNLNWETTNVIFTATGSSTKLAVAAATWSHPWLGVFLDAFKVEELDENPANVYYLPEQPLDALIGKGASGDWQLEIQDDRAGAGLTNLLVSWELQLVFANTNAVPSVISGGIGQSNQFLPAGDIAWYQINVPANANYATNRLLFASAPVNVWFSTNVPPTITNTPNDVLLIAGTNHSPQILSTNTMTWPYIVPGGTYYLGVQNTNNFTVNYGIEVDFDHGNAATSGLPAITGVSVSGGGIKLQWTASASAQFEVQWTDDLTQPWNTDTNVITSSDGNFSFTDDGSQTAPLGAMRYYRLVQISP